MTDRDQVVWKTEKEFAEDCAVSFWTGAFLGFVGSVPFWAVLALNSDINRWLIGVILSFQK